MRLLDHNEDELLKKDNGPQAGFSLLEIVMSLGIIMSLSIALTMMLRANLDIRDGLSQNAKVNQRLSSAMAQVARDLKHTYLLSEKDLARYGDSTKRKVKSLFKIDSRTNGDEVFMTTMSHVPLARNANEGDTTFVAYRLEDSKENGRPQLMRAEMKRVPESFRDEMKYRVIATDIKTFKVEAWKGDDWSKDRWDSTRREWRDKLPHLVKITIEGYEEDKLEDSSSVLSQSEEPVLAFQTVVILPNSLESKELRPLNSSIRWDKL